MWNEWKSLKASPNSNYVRITLWVWDFFFTIYLCEARGFFSCFSMSCVLHKIAIYWKWKKKMYTSLCILIFIRPALLLTLCRILSIFHDLEIWDTLSVGLKVEHYFNSVTHTHTQVRVGERERKSNEKHHTYTHVSAHLYAANSPGDVNTMNGLGRGMCTQIKRTMLDTRCKSECGCWMGLVECWQNKVASYRHGIVVLMIFPTSFTSLCMWWKMSQVTCIAVSCWQQ